MCKKVLISRRSKHINWNTYFILFAKLVISVVLLKSAQGVEIHSRDVQDSWVIRLFESWIKLCIAIHYTGGLENLGLEIGKAHVGHDGIRSNIASESVDTKFRGHIDKCHCECNPMLGLFSIHNSRRSTRLDTAKSLLFAW